MAACTSFSRFIVTEHENTLKDDFFEYLTFNWKSLVPRACWDWQLLPGVRCSIHDIYGLDKKLFFTATFNYSIGDGLSRRQMVFTLSYFTSFDNNLRSIERCNWDLNGSMEKLNDYLIPEMDDMDASAEALLAKVYEGAAAPGKIDVYQFANKLDLKVYTGRVVGWPQDIMGAVFFKEVDARLILDNGDILEQVPGFSIVVNPKVFQERNIGSVNNTIIHECVHFVFHWRVFAFRSITSDSYDGSVLCSTEANENDDNCTRQIERQATLIAPRVLMRKDDFISRTKFLINDYEIIHGEFRSLGKADGIIDADIVSKYVIPSLSSEYGVSELSVKIRMIDTGFEIARGVKLYLDDRYIRPFSFAEGSLGERETFTLSRSMYERLLSESDELKACIATGLFRFVENHVVFCSKQFCKPVNHDDGFILTDFARSHMHLCALRFRVDRKGSFYSYWSNAMSVMLRLPTMTATTSMIFLHESNEDLLKRSVEKHKEEWVTLYKKTSYGWNNRLKEIMKAQEFDIGKLARECNVSYETMRRYLADEDGHQMPKRIFTFVCMVLKIPDFISQKLISESSHLKFDSFKTEDACYLELLHHYYGQDIEYCNEYLARNGIEPFTNDFPQKEVKKRKKGLLDFSSIAEY